jgi:predicted DsbA family dithiol-disulfide isomerase
MGTPYGITFADLSVLRNSRNAHLAAEHARARGKFPLLHARLFSAYFSEGLDISDRDVLGQIGTDVGLDEADLLRSIDEGRYQERLERAQEEARSLGVTGVPTFFIGEKERLVGAQPIEVFRKALKKL